MWRADNDIVWSVLCGEQIMTLFGQADNDIVWSVLCGEQIMTLFGQFYVESR